MYVCARLAYHPKHPCIHGLCRTVCTTHCPPTLAYPAVEVILELDAVNEDPDRPRVVTSKDLRFVDPADEQYFQVCHFASAAEEELLAEADPGITIVKLGFMQRLKLRCIAKVGNGRIHTKFSPVCTVCMQYIPTIELVQELIERVSVKDRQEFVAACQPGVLTFDATTASVSVSRPEIANNTDEIERQGMLIARKYEFADNIVRVGVKPQEYIFDLETNGALSPAQVVNSAVDALVNKLSSCMHALSSTVM